MRSNPLDKPINAKQFHKDLAEMINTKLLTAIDTVIFIKYLEWSRKSGNWIEGKTYRSLHMRAYQTYRGVTNDILKLRRTFGQSKNSADMESLISGFSPAWDMDDTLKFLYVNLLINGIEKKQQYAGLGNQAIANGNRR